MNKEKIDEIQKEALSIAPKIVEIDELQQKRNEIAVLESQRVNKALAEIQVILDKYNVQLGAVAVVPATEIRIVPKK